MSGSYTISSVSGCDQGTWYCEAANSVPGIVKSAALSVYVKGKCGFWALVVSCKLWFINMYL